MTYSEAVVRIPVLSLWRHFKGNYYRVLHVARSSEDESPMVVYQNVKEQVTVWVRPASQWFDEVLEGVHRFERIYLKDLQKV